MTRTCFRREPKGKDETMANQERMFYEVYVGNEPNPVEHQGTFGLFDQAVSKANNLFRAGLDVSIYETTMGHPSGRWPRYMNKVSEFVH